MSRAYLDTDFVYVMVRLKDRMELSRPFMPWLSLVEDELGRDPPTISALTIDEVAYRLAVTWLRDDGDPDPLTTYRRDEAAVMNRVRRRLSSLWKTLDQLGPDLAPSNWTVVLLAQDQMASPGLKPRDAFHAASAITSHCRWIVSSDPVFDRVDRLDRLGPPAA